jgi:hypothetical protein
MKTHYNLEHLVKIKVFDFTLSEKLFYVKERKTWYGRIIPEHFEFRYMGVIDVPIEDYTSIIIKGYRVYFMPKIILYFTDGSTQSYYFDTYEDAEEKAEYFKKLSGKWTTVIESSRT